MTQLPLGAATAPDRICHCVGMDETLLARALAQGGANFGVQELIASHPHLFSHSAVFVDEGTRRTKQDVVEAVVRLVALPAYRELALARSHPNARIETRTRGVFLGYDFHLSQDGPQLIEIYTNAN